MVIASNVNAPYLYRLDEFLALNFRVTALDRAPLFTVTSRKSERAWSIPQANVGPAPKPIHLGWRRMRFHGRTPVDRRAEVCNLLAGILIDHERCIDILCYETLVVRPTETLSNLVDVFDRHFLPDNAAMYETETAGEDLPHWTSSVRRWRVSPRTGAFSVTTEPIVRP